MTEKTVSISIKIVKNLGDFNSLHIEAGMTAPFKDGESPDDAFDRVYDAVSRNLNEKIAEEVAELKAIDSGGKRGA